ncbi:hypothetical protein ACGH2B_28950 [Streptomyces sp. BBFR2]|uniref:hypothetical protein n=1 Tax=Streptomyces sp. BBFR2 TaxID=3372854 RepID=UPI0037DA1B50
MFRLHTFPLDPCGPVDPRGPVGLLARHPVPRRQGPPARAAAERRRHRHRPGPSPVRQRPGTGRAPARARLTELLRDTPGPVQTLAGLAEERAAAAGAARQALSEESDR